MLTVAYLAIQFPAAVEPYVGDEIEELRSRGVRVVAGSVRQPQADQLASAPCAPEIVLQRLRPVVLLRAFWLCMREWKKILPLVGQGHLSRGPATIQTHKSVGTHLVGSLLRSAVGGKRGRPHPRTSRLFWVLDCDGGRSLAEYGIQYDAPRLGFAAPWRLPLI